MTDRWWAPTRATVEPDAVVKVLLQPSGHPTGDLGATLLAVHRAGAAALETVSKGAVPSEVGLVNAMSSARERVAGLVVDAASSSMEARYAGLFVRDFFNDAESGALHLYRTAISKGVSRPIAVERVAAIYGVASKHLGQYTSLAIDPKANHVALTDAADRCLLTYVSKVVDAESEPIKEPVSKQTSTLDRPDTLEQDWDADEHPRGDGGRFANRPTTASPAELAMFRSMMGGGGSGAPPVGTEADRGLKPRPGQVVTPSGRVVRRANYLTVAGQPEPAAQVVQPASTQAQPILGKPILGRVITPELIRTQQINAAINPSGIAPSETSGDYQTRADAGYQGAVASSTSTDPYAGMYTELPVPVSFWVDAGTGAFFRANMGGPRAQRVLQVSDIPAAAEIHQHDSTAAIDSYTGLANKVKSDVYDLQQDTFVGQDYIAEQEAAIRHPQVDPVRAEDIAMAVLHGQSKEKYLDKQRLEHAEAAAQTSGRTVDYELQHTYSLPSFSRIPGTEDHQDLIVHVEQPPPADFESRPVPIADEYHMTSGVRGFIEDTGSKSQEVHLDPDQYLMIDRSRYVQYYDVERQLIVNSYEVTPIQESEAQKLIEESGLGPMKKALDTKERTTFNQLHPRDVDGQFADIMSRRSAVAPTASSSIAPWSRLENKDPRIKERPQPRTPRKTRQANISVVKPQPVQEEFDTKLGLKPQPVTGQQIAGSKIIPTQVMRAYQVMAAKLKAKLPHPFGTGKKTLSRDKNYQLMTQDQFVSFIKAGSREKVPFEADFTRGFLSNQGKEKLKRGMEMSPDKAMDKAKSLIRAFTESSMEFKDNFTIHKGSEEADMAALKAKVKTMMDSSPEMVHATVTPLMPNDADLFETFGELDPDSPEYEAMANAYASRNDLELECLIEGNTNEVAPLYLIESDPYSGYIDPEMDLMLEGKYSIDDIDVPGLSSRSVNPVTSSNFTDPTSMQSAKVHLYRVNFSDYLFNPEEEDPLPKFPPRS